MHTCKLAHLSIIQRLSHSCPSSKSKFFQSKSWSLQLVQFPLLLKCYFLNLLFFSHNVSAQLLISNQYFMQMGKMQVICTNFLFPSIDTFTGQNSSASSTCCQEGLETTLCSEARFPCISQIRSSSLVNI